jgi:protein SCO1/2
MNDRPLFRLALALGVIAALPLAACGQSGSEPPLKGAAIGGPFTLTDQDGRQVSERDFAGRYRITYFGFTYCPDVCPTDMQTIAQGLRLFEKEHPALGAKVQPIFISVDPGRDGPAELKQFVGAFHPRLVGLTGTPQQVAAVAKSHGVYYARQEPAKGATGYNVDHSRVATLFGPDGKPIAILPYDQGPEAVAAELERWVT